MMRKMWFGTKKFARWIKVHSPGSTYTAAGHSARIDYLNGGVGLRRSLSGHEELQLTWNRLTGQEAREITDFAYGTYGDGPFYLSDPGAQRFNVLNKQWSMPGLTGKDGVPLAGKKRPELVANLDQSRGYPVDMAKYPVNETTPRRSFYVPVPPGMTAWVGVHGDEDSTAGVEVQPTVSGVQAGASTIVPVVGVDTAQRVTHSFPATGDQSGIELSLEAAGSVTNLFTNPSFAAGSGTVEVRRNLFPDPLFVSTPSGTGYGYPWTIYQRCSVENNGNGSITVERVTTAGNCGPGSGNVVVVTPGQVVTISAWVSDVSEWARVRCIGLNNAANADVGSQVLGNSVTSAEPGWSSATITIPEGADRLNFQLQVSSTLGDKATFSKVLIEIAGERREFFAPGLPSPDPDLTASWTDAANASASVLTGVPVAGVTADNCLAIRSSRWAKEGTRSLRVITTGAGPFVTIPAPVGQHTALVTAHLESPLPDTDAVFPSLTNGSETDLVPNVAGDHDLRITGNPYPGLNGFLLTGGPSVGDNVWYDCAGLFEGTYDGPWFSGDSEGAEWDGTPNASSSTRSTSFATIAGMIVQVLPTGTAPEPGDFISGQGMNGADFDGVVRPTPYSFEHDSYGLAVNLVETEDWR